MIGRPKKWTQEAIEAEAEALLEWFQDPARFWLKDFAIEREYPSEYFSRFASESEVFSQALKRAKEIQESRLVRMGFSKKVNPAMAVFALKNVAGWRDNPEQIIIREREVLDYSKLNDAELEQLQNLLRRCSKGTEPETP